MPATPATVEEMSYQQVRAPAPLRELAECLWTVQGPRRGHILPDGCMDLVAVDGTILVAGPDTTAHISEQRGNLARGIRFRPGALPRLLGVPAAELRNIRVPLRELRADIAERSLGTAAIALLRNADGAGETSPWSVPQLARVTDRLAHGAAVSSVADEIGWSARTVQRQCAAVYGYGPATLRRVLRFRRAVALLRAGTPPADAAVWAGYADQPHLHREVREFAGLAVSDLHQPGSGANRSTVVPSGSTTLA